MPRPRT